MADDNLVELIYKSPIKSFMSAWQVKNEVELNWETINNVWKFIQAHKYLGRIPPSGGHKNMHIWFVSWEK